MTAPLNEQEIAEGERLIVKQTPEFARWIIGREEKLLAAARRELMLRAEVERLTRELAERTREREKLRDGIERMNGLCKTAIAAGREG